MNRTPIWIEKEEKALMEMELMNRPGTSNVAKHGDWYTSLIHDLRCMVFEGIINTKHSLGTRILQDYDKFQKGTGHKIEDIALDMDVNKSEVYNWIRFAQLFPVLSDDVRNKSWRDIVRNCLYDPKEKPETPPLPEGKYPVILADPPWQYDNSGFEQSAASHYPTMPTEEIAKVAQFIHDKSVLFLWCTNPFLREGIEICKAWGFDYKTNFVWVKNKGPGIGWFNTSRHELLLIGTIGKGMHPHEKYISWFEGEVTKHSKKPITVYEMIEQMYAGPYIELFARNTRDLLVRVQFIFFHLMPRQLFDWLETCTFYCILN